MSDIDQALPLGTGDWTAALVDRATGAELLLEPTGWRGTANRASNEVSEAALVIDLEYAVRIGRRPRTWLDEVHLWRDGLLSWVGPVTSIDDAETDGVVWNAQDRMAIVTERRWFWSSETYAGDITNLMATALEHANLSDPTGLILDPILTGVISDMTVIAGDKIGEAIRNLGIAWTVVADVLRFGDIYVDTGVLLEAGAWGQDRPTIAADGFQRLSHVCAVCDNGARVFYPSPDPNDRLPGSPLLVDTIDVGDVSARAARNLARAAWVARQGELSIVPEEARPVGPEFPLGWPYLVPGLTMIASSEGTQLTADEVPVKLTEVTAEFADGEEQVVTVAIDEAPQVDLIDPFLINVVETSLASVFPPGQSYPGRNPTGPVDWNEIGLDPIIDVLPPEDDFEWEVIDPLPDPDYDVISWPGSDLPNDPGDDPFPDPPDPFADCPPSYCCDQCNQTPAPDPDPDPSNDGGSDLFRLWNFGSTSTGGWSPSGDQWSGSPSTQWDIGPIERLQFPGTALEEENWTSGIPVLAGHVSQGGGAVGFDYIEALGTDGPGFDAAQVPALPFQNPATRLNFGGYYLVTGTDHGADSLPGSHAHVAGATDLVLPDYNPERQNTRMAIIRDAGSIEEFIAASSITTMTAGVPVGLPALIAPGPNWLLVWIIQVGVPAAAFASDPVLTLGPSVAVSPFNEPKFEGFSPSQTSSGSIVDTDGGTVMAWWAPDEGGSYAPTLTSDVTLECVISAMRCGAPPAVV